MPVNTATLNQIFDGSLGPIAVQEAKGAATRAGKQILQDGISAAFGSSSSQIDKFLTQINSKGIARNNLFEVKLKPYINRSDGSSKGDWDVGITIDIMEYASKSDVIVLASGDGDFDILMDRVKTLYNSKTEIYGVSNLTAISLKNSTSNFFPIGKELLLG